MEEAKKKYTKYEHARIIGSRALQISMGAPFLIKLGEKDLEKIRYNPVEIAKMEFKEGVIPIDVKTPFPKSRYKEEEEAAEEPPESPPEEAKKAEVKPKTLKEKREEKKK